MTPDPAADLDRFYGLLHRLEWTVGGTRTLADCHGRLGWPQRGVYFFFEPGEVRRDGSPRVTRVGTHALTATSKATLWGRPAQHRAVDDPPGRTSHRGLVERNAIALLSRRVNPQADPPSPGWLGLHAVASEIRTSGLWNVNHVDGPYDRAFLDVLEDHLAELEYNR